ncbi:MAG: metal-dependent transcriptional regulator [Chloroflexi bacterium]|nr:metal-dependent transcriptional regulator [Chloroflexota bacterium]
MRDHLTHAIEDYLKTIYDLSVIHGRASTTQLAKSLEVTPASVTGMLQKLAAAEPPLVDYQKHRGVVLTTAGEKVALEILRTHRLLELFLHKTLGYSWDQVDAEADQLEHVISGKFEERIAQALGDPTHDPHGDPIPTRDLEMPSHAKICLCELQPGQQGTIERVRDHDAELLRYLSERGVVPKAAFKIIEHSPFDDNLTLELEGQKKHVVLGPRVVHQIFVEPDEENYLTSEEA